MGHLKKLLYTKKLSDSEEGYVWKLSPYKLVFWLVLFAVLLFVAYAFMREDTTDFLKECLVYAMIGLIVVAIFILLYGAGKAIKTKLQGYIIALTFIFLTYVVLGVIMNFIFNISFNYGYGAWILMLTLAGFHKIDGVLDRRDVFYACMCILAIIGANLPWAFGGKSILDVLTYIVKKIASFISNFNFSMPDVGNFTG